jgi:hypothetical protein
MVATAIIALCALVVSTGSLVISILSYRRVSKLEEPIAWAETTALIVENCWVITVHLRNPSRYAVRPAAISVPIERVPVDDRQDFLLADYSGVFKESENDIVKLRELVQRMSTKSFKMSVPDDTPLVSQGESFGFRALLYRGRLSTATTAEISLSYYVMKEQPSYKTKKMRLSIAGPTITLQLTKV